MADIDYTKPFITVNPVSLLYTLYVSGEGRGTLIGALPFVQQTIMGSSGRSYADRAKVSPHQKGPATHGLPWGLAVHSWADI